jgi:repressor LexA
MQPLTQRQDDAYEFIRDYLREHRRPPTLQEIGEALGIRSTNGVYKLLQALEKKGYIEREKHAARSIRLVDDTATDPLARDGGQPMLPVVSRTPSDQPERLRERPRRLLSIDDRLFPRGCDPDDCIIGPAGDDGMNGDGILKGDLLLVEEQPWDDISNGTLVAALIGEKLQARRFDYANGRLHLRPASRHYTEETFPPDAPDCYVIGRVIGLIRTL